MTIKSNIQIWQLSKEMFGDNSNEHCRILKKLTRHYKVEELDTYWSRITDITLKDDCGWLIPINCLEL